MNDDYLPSWASAKRDPSAGMAKFTGLGTPAPEGSEKGGGAASAALWGAFGAMIGSAMTKRREAHQPQPAMSEKEVAEQSAELLFSCWDSLLTMRTWLEIAGPVEDWDGDLMTNVRACQYLQKFFPEVFESWRTRNYYT